MVDVDMWLLCGQSNNQGTPSGKGNTAPFPGNYEPAPSNKYPAQAFEWEEGFGVIPLADGRTAGWLTVKYKALPGSAWPAFFNTYCRYTTRKQVAVRCAIGGTSVLLANTNTQAGHGDWSAEQTDPDQARFPRAIDRALAAKAAIEAGGDTVKQIHVIWHGGEGDAKQGNGLTDGSFLAAFKALLPRFRTALASSMTGMPALKMYVARIGNPGPSVPQYDDECALVRHHQDVACAEVDGMEMAYTDCVHFPEWGLMRADDDIHYSQPGYNLMGNALAKFVAVDQGLTEIEPEKPLYDSSLLAQFLSLAPAVPAPPPPTPAFYVSYNAAGVSGAAAGVAVTGPAGLVGDLVIAFCAANNTTATWTPPAGWTAADQDAAAGAGIFYRTATDTGGTSWTFTRSNTVGAAGVVLVRVREASAVAASDIVNAGASTSVVLPSVTAAANNTMLLGIVMKVTTTAGTWTPPGTATERVDTTTTGTALPFAVVDELVAAGATGTRTVTSTNSQQGRGAIVALSP